MIKLASLLSEALDTTGYSQDYKKGYRDGYQDGKKGKYGKQFAIKECEDCGRDWNHGHDHEAGMAKNELRDMISNASKIDQMVKEGDNLPGWVSAYISLAADYMHSVAEYLAGESSRRDEPGPGYDGMVYEDEDSTEKDKPATDYSRRRSKEDSAYFGLSRDTEDEDGDEDEYVSDYSRRRAKEKSLREAKKPLKKTREKVATAMRKNVKR